MSLGLYPAGRRNTVAVKVGSVVIGGGAPIVVQSMTNTDTADLDATVKQIQQLVAAGSELVRITVNTRDAAKQVAPIRDRLAAKGCQVPLTVGLESLTLPVMLDHQIYSPCL